MKSKKTKTVKIPISRMEQISLSVATKAMAVCLKGKDEDRKRDFFNIVVGQHLPGYHVHGAPIRKKSDVKKKVKPEEQSAA
jgi:hypothetical protein